MAENNPTGMPQMPPPYFYAQQRKSRWWIPVLIVVIIIAFFVIIIGSIFSSLTSSFEKEPVNIKQNSVLVVNLGNSVQESVSDSPFAFMAKSHRTNFHDLLTAIHRAKVDPRITGIYYRGNITAIGSAQAEELIKVIDDFKTSGKFIYAYIDYGRKNDYYNLLPADKIFLSPEGIIEMNAFGTSSVFLKGLFEKLGVDYNVLGFEDFKSAGEAFSRKNFSDSARLQLRAIIEQRHRMFASQVAKSRNMTVAAVNQVMSRGVYTADSLLALGFVDSLCYESSVKDIIKAKVTGSIDTKDEKMNYVSVGDYMNDESPVKMPMADRSKQIAVIYAVGPLIEKAQSAFGGDKNITAKEFVKYLKLAREDKNVKVIILRVDSPGGSVMASDEIYQEIIKTKKVKPIYASMGNVAASGGYYISVPCDTIIAQPSTITGSIGVIMLIPNFSGMIGKLGITADTISSGSSSQFMNGLFPAREADRAKILTLGRGIYDRFINKVAENRHKTYDETRALAKGRVWTGEDAQKRGLVDVLGGLETAFSIAKKRMGIPESQKVVFKEYPEKKDNFADFIKMFLDEDVRQEKSGSQLTNILANYLGTKPENVMDVFMALPAPVRSSITFTLNLIGVSQKERAILAMPYDIVIE